MGWIDAVVWLTLSGYRSIRRFNNILELQSSLSHAQSSIEYYVSISPDSPASNANVFDENVSFVSVHCARLKQIEHNGLRVFMPGANYFIIHASHTHREKECY